MRLLLVRHAETAANRGGLIQGWVDLPPTERGQEQARRTGRALAGQGLRLIYSSPLRRAWETARAIAQATGAEVVACEDLREISCGQADGLAWADFQARWPTVAAAFGAGDLECPWPGGESTRQMLARVIPAVGAIVARHRAEAEVVAVVSHGGPLAWIVPWLRGERYEVWPPYRLDPCSITEFMLGAQGEAELVRLNDCGHLVECA